MITADDVSHPTNSFSSLADMNTAHTSLSKRNIVFAYGQALEAKGAHPRPDMSEPRFFEDVAHVELEEPGSEAPLSR